MTVGGRWNNAGGRFDWRLYGATVRSNASAVEALNFGLHTPQRKNSDDWIYDHEAIRTLAAISHQAAIDLAGDKARFAAFLAKNGLSHVPTIAAWENGAIVSAQDGPWPDGIVLKPARANNARGLELWRRHDGFYRMATEELDAEALRERCRNLSRAWGGFLAQPAIQLHPEFVRVGLKGMPTTRICTGAWPDGKVQLLDGYLSAPLPGRFASNDGIGSYWAVDLASGRVSPSLSETHAPWTGPPTIDDFTLPGWQAACEIVIRGHQLFPGKIAVVGWDVAYSVDGPVVIEANTGIGFSFEQAMRRTPAGPGPIGRLLDAWIRELRLD
jgi:hypothetical protein